MAERRVLEAREAFDVTRADRSPLAIRPGDRYYSDDPIIRGREHLFGELTVKSSAPPRSTTAATETATAAPGARRTVSRPPAGQADGGKSDA